MIGSQAPLQPNGANLTLHRQWTQLSTTRKAVPSALNVIRYPTLALSTAQQPITISVEEQQEKPAPHPVV
jgi:hypothetical protein